MSKTKKNPTIDLIIIAFIIFVFLLVFIVFYYEINKKINIAASKKNFYIVKHELLNEFRKCDKKQSWVFDIPCDQSLTKKTISKYFNKNRKLKNPYDGFDGVEGNPGSVKINIKDKIIVLSIDIDNNDGIDIEHKIYIK